jgi:acrylyl-CoA reductase (NADPH)
MFKAILVERDPPPYRAEIKSLEEAQLPANEVTVRVAYSTLNYKDALAITGKGPVVRQFPPVPWRNPAMQALQWARKWC